MKYFVVPILRFLPVVTFLACFPILLIGYLLFALWHWDLKEVKDLIYCLTNEFESQSNEVQLGQQYFYYRNPWDYIIQKKSWKYKN